MTGWLRSGGSTTSGSDQLNALSDFFGSTTWTALLIIIQIFGVALWLALGYWVYQDSRRRFENAGAITGSTAIALIIPLLGPLIYLFIRPPEYLTDAHDREMETLALEAQVGGLRCPECEAVVGSRFLVCPMCTAPLREPCRRCSEPLDPIWHVCPYCATPAYSQTGSAAEETRIS